MLVPCVDPCQGRININKRRKYKHKKFIRVLSAAHLIHLNILTLTRLQQKDMRASTIDKVTEVEFSEHCPPTGLPLRAIMQLKYIQV